MFLSIVLYILSYSAGYGAGNRRVWFHLHFTPTSSSWLNLIERWFRELTTKRLRRGSFQSIPALIKAITDYLNNHNQNPQVFVWRAPVERLRAKVAMCLSTWLRSFNQWHAGGGPGYPVPYRPRGFRSQVHRQKSPNVKKRWIQYTSGRYARRSGKRRRSPQSARRERPRPAIAPEAQVRVGQRQAESLAAPRTERSTVPVVPGCGG